MPRVIQVESSHGVDSISNMPYVNSSDRDHDALSKYYNQRIKNAPEPIAGHMRFAVNYTLYNVTYSESDNDPYCLKCIRDGQEIKFKKDARTWLHKSSERKRRRDDENRSDDTAEIKNSKLELHNLDANGKGSHNVTYSDIQSNFPKPDVLRSKTELIVCAHSDADLTSSEESSTPLCGTSRDDLNTVNATITKDVRFDDSTYTGYRVHTVSSCSDESLNSLRKATSTTNLYSQG